MLHAALLALALTALPQPPEKVVFENAKGTVTLDHAAHNARRVGCPTCHGPGVVEKIPGFEMQRAHLVCVGCHRTRAKGPTLCKDCHRASAAPDPGGEAGAAEAR